MRVLCVNSALVTLFVSATLLGATQTEDRAATVRFLGGAKKIPLVGLKVTIRAYTGDWSFDQQRTLTDGKTNEEGNVALKLADGRYYVEIRAEKEMLYLDRPVGFKSPPNSYSRMIEVGKEHDFEFNLADACKLTLRAVDLETGQGIPGVCFVTESETAEDWGIAIYGDNLGANHKQQHDELTDANGYLIRYLGPRDGYTYFAWPEPKGYEYVGKSSVSLPTPIGTEKVEHAFKFKKKK